MCLVVLYASSAQRIYTRLLVQRLCGPFSKDMLRLVSLDNISALALCAFYLLFFLAEVQ